MVRLRASTKADTDSLYRVWRSSVDDTHDFVAPDDLDRIARLVREAYLPDAPLTVACADGGRIVAFMGMTDCAIDSLFVASDARGSGVGRTLIEHAKQRCPDGLQVEVNEHNVQAVGFYEHLGFTISRRLPRDRQGKPYPLLVMVWPGSGASAPQ